MKKVMRTRTNEYKINCLGFMDAISSTLKPQEPCTVDRKMPRSDQDE